MPPPAPELPDELLDEAFLRLPLDDPACLIRASLTCKRWRRILADPAFRRRHRDLHRTPSVVGLLHIAGHHASRFVVPNSSASGRPAARYLPGRVVLDCRHGRALFYAPRPSVGTEQRYDLVVWDPLTNKQRCLSCPLPSPEPRYFSFNAAVLCAAAAESCEHRTCHGGPFRVALVWTHIRALFARVYSSETDNWGEAISIPQQHPETFLDILPSPSTLVGDTLYFRSSFKSVLEYQLGAQRLSIIEGPPRRSMCRCVDVFISPMGNSGLRCMNVEEDESSFRLQLWSREAASDSDKVAGWTRGSAIDLEKLLPNSSLPSPRKQLTVKLLGFAEGTDVIFVGTVADNAPHVVYMVQLNSGTARKVFELGQWPFVVPYTSFCIPVTDASSTTEGSADNASSA